MIEDKKMGLKIAENPKEAMIENAIKQIEDKVLHEELGLEIDKVVLEYLKKKRKRLRKRLVVMKRLKTPAIFVPMILRDKQ